MLLGSVPPVPPVIASQQRFSAQRVLRDERFDKRTRTRNMFDFVLFTEISHGTQFLYVQPEGTCYVVLGLTQDIIRIPNGRSAPRWFSYFMTAYGFSEGEEQARFVFDSLRAYIIEHGQRCEARRFAVYNVDQQIVYLSAYNGRMYKIDGHETTDCPVGEDGVFFLDDDHGCECIPNIGQHGLFLDRLTDVNFKNQSLGGSTAEEQRRALIVWAFALAFPDLQPTKPILLVEGAHGSGKTSAIKFMQLILFGYSRPMMLQRDKENDFAVLLLRNPIALFDNNDTFIEWVPDAVAAYATGGVVTKRKLYTDDESITIKAHAFVAVSTRNPASFRRADVAERCIVLHLDRRRNFTPESELQEQILADRPQLLGEYIWYVEQIVRALRDRGDAPLREEGHRMADFAAFTRVVGGVMGWSDDEVDALLTSMQNERDAFVTEEDPLIELLNAWLAYRPRGARGNPGRTIAASDLRAELDTLCTGDLRFSGMQFKESARSLVQKLKSPHLERAFHVEIQMVDQRHMLRIWRPHDPRLVEDTTIEVPA